MGGALVLKLLLFVILTIVLFTPANGVESIAFQELLFQTCANPCTLRTGTSPPFKISYKVYKEGSRFFVDVELNDKKFPGLVVSLDSADGYLPFYQYQFFDDHRFGMYELISSSHISTEYSHYFVQKRGQFSYLGLFASLSYDANDDVFIAREGHGRGDYWKRTYKLVENRLVEQ